MLLYVYVLLAFAGQWARSFTSPRWPVSYTHSTERARELWRIASSACRASGSVAGTNTDTLTHWRVGHSKNNSLELSASHLGDICSIIDCIIILKIERIGEATKVNYWRFVCELVLCACICQYFYPSHLWRWEPFRLPLHSKPKFLFGIFEAYHVVFWPPQRFEKRKRSALNDPESEQVMYLVLEINRIGSSVQPQSKPKGNCLFNPRAS